MPQVSEPFQLTLLPQTSLGRSSASGVRAAADPDLDSKVYLGISHSAITSYVLQPSPHLVWTHTLPPGNSVTALEVHKSSEFHSGEARVYFGVNDGKKNTLWSVKYAADANLSDPPAPDSSAHISVPAPVSSISLASSGSRLFAVLANSSVNCYDADLASSAGQPLWVSKAKADRQLIFSSFIPPSDNDSELDAPEFGSVVLVSTRTSGRKPILEVRTLALETAGASEISSKEIEITESDIKSGLVVSYNHGVIYRYRRETHQVLCYPILASSLLASSKFSVPPSSASEEQLDSASILSIGSRNLLLSHGSRLTLIDTEYKSAIAHRDLDAPVTLLSHISEARTAVAVTQSSDVSTSSVVGITVDTGKGTLLESLGKGVGLQTDTDPWRHSFADIVIKKNYNLREYSNVARDIISISQSSSLEILGKIQALRESEALGEFEYRTIQYLKGQEWDEVKYSTASILDNTDDEDFPAYEADKDREVDKEFIFELVDLLFENTESSSENNSNHMKLGPLPVPEKLVIYLLTHPLFPTPELPGLLRTLRPYPRLLRQAIVTAPSIDCVDLIEELANPSNEIFGDTVARILEDFGPTEIADAVNMKYARSKDAVDIVNRLVRLDVGWPLISYFIDAGGLFGWDAEMISQLHGSVSSQVDALISSSETMTLIDEALRKFDIAGDASGKKPKSAPTTQSQQQKSTERVKPELISSEAREQKLTKGLLQLGVQEVTPSGDSKKKRAIRQGNLISKKVPQYTVEKLVL